MNMLMEELAEVQKKMLGCTDSCSPKREEVELSEDNWETKHETLLKRA